MKKLPIILTTLIMSAVFAGLFSEKAQAFYIAEDGSPWWTVSELLEYKKTVDGEAKELCGDDTECVRDFYRSKEMDFEDEKNMALMRLLRQQFAVTSINPHQEKIKILFFDTDMMRLLMSGEEHQIDFQDIHLSWFDEDFEKRSYYAGNYSSYKQEIRNNAISGIHNIYSYNSQLDGKNPFPANQEVEIDASGTNLAGNSSGIVNFYVNSARNFNVAGGAQYKDCLLAADYGEGTECRLMFSGIMGPRYMPPRETVMTILAAGLGSSGENQGSNSNVSVAKESIKVQDNNQPVLPKAPDTGSNSETMQTCGKTVEFPWWLAGLIAFGDAVVLWLFWPKRRK